MHLREHGCRPRRASNLLPTVRLLDDRHRVARLRPRDLVIVAVDQAPDVIRARGALAQAFGGGFDEGDCDFQLGVGETNLLGFGGAGAVRGKGPVEDGVAGLGGRGAPFHVCAFGAAGEAYAGVGGLELCDLVHGLGFVSRLKMLQC